MTPLEPAPELLAPGTALYLKREDAHELGAFKWRGALPALEGYRGAGATGVVTASTGNHGAATAWAARELGLRAVVFVPHGAARVKVERIEALGAELRFEGDDFDEAKERAAAFATAEGLPLFEDGSEPAQYDGYAAIGREIAAELDGAGTVVVPLGNGALLGGVAQALHPLGWEVVAVVAKNAPVMADSLDAGRAVSAHTEATIADGLAVRVAIPYAVERIRSLVDRVVRVSERELAGAIGRLAEQRVRVEASAAASVAALAHLDRPREPVVLVITGRNIDEALFARACADPGSFPG
jgi:threonine dehydratase